MKITVLGAAGGEVTGSAYLVETRQARVLIDCGLFQGGKKAVDLNRPPLGADSSRLDAVLLTHAHLDHTGRLPLLAQSGFSGPIFATPATIELTELILRDSTKIQAQDAERQKRRSKRTGEMPIAPLYTSEETETILRQLKPIPYCDPITVATGIKARFAEAGHMLGSASIQLLVNEGDSQRKIVFSGDLGPMDAPILRDFDPFPQADMVFLESTYGDRDHRPYAATVQEFIEIVTQAVAQKGKMLAPTFAVGRAQLLLALLASIFRKKLIAPFPIFLDSPMAIEASRIYARHRELFDAEMVEYLKAGSIIQDLPSLRLSVTADDSKQINFCPGPCFIMAGAGMCNAGRILHHLRHNLGNPEAHVIIVGFQASDTLGRLLVNGAKRITIFGEDIQVRARIHTLGGFSAHAGQTDLLKWFDVLAPSKPRVVLTHGEDGPRAALAQMITQRHGITPHLPSLGDVIDLCAGVE